MSGGWKEVEFEAETGEEEEDEEDWDSWEETCCIWLSAWCKELKVEDICTLFNITNSSIDDSNVKDIYAVMPNSLTHFDIYYNQNEPCSTASCKAFYTARNIG